MSAFLYFSVVWILLSRRRWYFLVFGIFALAVSLSFLGLPDLDGYKEHWDYASVLTFSELEARNNFEIGYNVSVWIFSMVMPWELFYIIVISLAVFSYLKFYEEYGSEKKVLYAAAFLALFLYFTAFTFRTTISSILLVLSVLSVRNDRNLMSILFIVLGSTFHSVILPMLILPFINRYSSLINRHFLIMIFLAISAGLVFNSFFTLDKIAELSDFLRFKVQAYEDVNTSYRISIFQVFWFLLFVCGLLGVRKLDRFDRVLFTTLSLIITLLIPYNFFQARFFWLTSFLAAYFFAKLVLARIKFDLFSISLVVFVSPILVLFRFS